MTQSYPTPYTRNPAISPRQRTDENQFYETEADDGDMELSGTHLSGSKEALEDPPEDEARTLEARENGLHHPLRHK